MYGKEFLGLIIPQGDHARGLSESLLLPPLATPAPPVRQRICHLDIKVIVGLFIGDI
jgi:hypothetical protein